MSHDTSLGHDPHLSAPAEAPVVDSPRWEPLEEIRSDAADGGAGVEMLLQKGLYHFTDQRPAQIGYRLVWREDGELRVRSPWPEEMAEIDALFRAARERGWQ